MDGAVFPPCYFSSAQFICVWLFSLDCSMTGLPVHHKPPEFTQTHVHWVSDAIQLSHPLSSPSPPAFNLSQHQGLFKWVFSLGGQSIGVSSSTSVLPMNTQDWSPLGWTGWISLQFKGLSRVFSNTTVQKYQFFGAQLSSQPNSHIHTWLTTGKTIALTRWTFVGKVMSLLFNILFQLVITFLPRSKCLLISWLQSPSAVILEPPKIKNQFFSPVICLGPNYGGSHEDNGNLLQKVPCMHRYTQCPQPCSRPPPTDASAGNS